MEFCLVSILFTDMVTDSTISRVLIFLTKKYKIVNQVVIMVLENDRGKEHHEAITWQKQIDVMTLTESKL